MNSRFTQRPPETALNIIPWWQTLSLAACLLWLAGHADGLASYFEPWWEAMYLLSALGLLGWRLRPTDGRWLLVTFGACLWSASVTRLGLFLFRDYLDDGGRASGMALNAIVALFAWRFTQQQASWSA